MGSGNVSVKGNDSREGMIWRSGGGFGEGFLLRPSSMMSGEQLLNHVPSHSQQFQGYSLFLITFPVPFRMIQSTYVYIVSLGSDDSII